MSDEIIERKVNRVWLTCPWEVNLLMGENARIERMNQLADYLSDKGYDVTLWFTTFEHPTKKYIANETKVVDYKPNLHIVLLHCPVPYKRNTSPIRFYHLSYLAKEMKRCIKDEEKFPVPDVILAGYPSEQNCRVLERYAAKKSIPVIIDPRDMWPDIFERAFPKVLGPFVSILLFFMKMRTKQVFEQADAICGIHQPIQDWALSYAVRKKTEMDRYVFFGAQKKLFSLSDKQKALNRIHSMGINEKTWNLCFFASLSRTALDLETVIAAVKRIYNYRTNIRLIIGGKGDSEEYYKSHCEDCPGIVMAGWLNEPEMASVMEISQIGILCYRNTKDFRDGWGNKVGQYFSYGLPLLTSAEGVAKTYSEEYECGVYYPEGDVNELENILVYLMDNPRRIDEMTSNSKKRFDEDFKSDVVMHKFETLINDISCIKAKGVNNEKSIIE